MVIFIETINNILWIIITIIILYNSIYFSIKLKFPQFNIKAIINTLFNKETKSKISSIDTLFMSLASKIGVGSLAGIAFAIYYGGIGSLFWIWIFSFFIAINSYLENYLSIIYKKKDGLYYKGGPAYYINYGLHNKILSIIYVVLLIITYIFGFLTIQNNTITKLINLNYSIPLVIVSFIVSILSFYFIVKGLKSISNLCNKIVPVMSIIYLIVGLIVLIINISDIDSFFISVLESAFNYKSAIGGIVSTFIIGIQKSVFSSEAGLGTGAIASGASSCFDPKKQGFIGIVSTYFINLAVASITGFIIFFSPYQNVSFSNFNGIELTKYSFSYHLGFFGETILLILIILFAFSTIVTGYYYSESNLKLFTNKKLYIWFLKIFTIIIIFIGGLTPSLIIWNVIDIFIGILSLINIYAIYKLKDKILS